jgi:hypothetical protein
MERRGKEYIIRRYHCLPNHFHFQYKNKIIVNEYKNGNKTRANTHKFWKHANKKMKLSTKSFLTSMLRLKNKKKRVRQTSQVDVSAPSDSMMTSYVKPSCLQVSIYATFPIIYRMYLRATNNILLNVSLSWVCVLNLIIYHITHGNYKSCKLRPF